jgi:hypothetical protein
MTSLLTSALSPGLTSARTPDDAERRGAEKARGDNQVMKSLMDAQARGAEQRKGMARQRVERIKQQLEQLRLMGASPLQIAHLARELSAAVKAYGADPGAATAKLSTSVQPQAPAQPPGETPAQGDLAAQAATAAQGAADQYTADKGDADKDPANKDGEDARASKPETPYDKALRAMQEDAARTARRSTQAQEDREFLGLARRLAEQLKQAAEEAARKAGADSGETQQAEQAAQSADQAVADAERALLQATGGATAGLFLSV